MQDQWCRTLLRRARVTSRGWLRGPEAQEPAFLPRVRRFLQGAGAMCFCAAVLMVVFVVSPVAAHAADQASNKPISKHGLEQAVKIGGLSTAELVAIIQKRGVDFQVTKDVEIELLRDGVKAEVIDACRANFKGTPASPASLQGGLNGNWTGTYKTCAGGQSTMRMSVKESSPEDIDATVSIDMPYGTPATFTVEGVLNTMNSFLVLHLQAWQHQPPGVEIGNIGGYVTYNNQQPSGFSGMVRAPGCAAISLTKQ